MQTRRCPRPRMGEVRKRKKGGREGGLTKKKKKTVRESVED